MSSFKLAIIASLILSYFIIEAHGHTCNHDHKKRSPGLIDVDEGFPREAGRTLQDAPNIRIYPYYDMLEGSSEFASYLRYDLIPPVIAYFEAALKVVYPLGSPIKVDDDIEMMCDYETPTILQTTGVDADHFFFFVIDSDSSNFIATAEYCQLSRGLKRPIVSQVIFNMNGLKIPNGNPLIHEQNVVALMHEMLHAFGFSSGLYDYFVDSNGNLLQGHVKYQGDRMVLDVPPLTNRLRKHFGCSSLPGAFLENGGDSELTAGSHFERRMFLIEFMTSGLLDAMRVSEFSLALLEGSGWYIPDYNYAEPFYFGAGEGCDFLYNECSNQKQFDEFCVGPEARGCSASGRTGGFCKSDSLTEGCRYYDPSIYFDCENPHAATQTRLSDLQVFGRGAGSKCFEGTLSSRTNDRQNSFCFKFECSGSGQDTTLSVQVGDQSVLCTEAGDMYVEGYEGAIRCPDPLQFCSTTARQYCPRGCMGRGKCEDNQCTCDDGFDGVDCSLRLDAEY